MPISRGALHPWWLRVERVTAARMLLQVVFLNRRRGFIRMAITAGAPLVPVFIFGQVGTQAWGGDAKLCQLAGSPLHSEPWPRSCEQPCRRCLETASSLV